jgi:hypothetical protein
MDRRGLIRMSRKFGIAPIFTDQIRRGKIVELPDDKAQALIDHGYAIRAQRRNTDPITVDDTEVTTPEDVLSYKGANFLEDDDDYPEDLENEDRDVAL